MHKAVARMSCLLCGHRWQAEAALRADSAYVIVDDLCPKCEAQGEPEELILPEQSHALLQESLPRGPVWPNSNS
jgi:hypothetical protein